MGVKIRDILILDNKNLIRPISFSDLQGKSVAVDAANAIYQFLAIVQSSSGQPLLDNQGRITSHLSGLFYRSISLLEKDIKPVYVFDGKPPKLKAKTIQERRETREEAYNQWKVALEEGDMVAAKKYGQAAQRMTSDIVQESKQLLDAMGIPYVQAISEGEAQASYMIGKDNIEAVASQDFDALLYGAPQIIRNLSLSEKRKIPGESQYIKVEPEKIIISEVLESLDITQEQLIDVAILIGTDFNDGIKGVGAKTALKLIKTYKDLKTVIKKKSYEFTRSEEEIEEIRQFFLHPQVIEDYKITFRKPNEERIRKILVDEHQFSSERVEKHLKRLQKVYAKGQQKSLERWF